MKKNKIKIITIIFAIILIALVAFLGVYVKFQNRMENKVKDYNFAIDLKGSRIVELSVRQDNKTVIKHENGNIVASGAQSEIESNYTDETIQENNYTKEEEPYNKEEVLTKENYNRTKQIIDDRLKRLGVDNYILRLDENTGKIVIELTDDENTDDILSTVVSTGELEIVDAETYEVLLSNNDIKDTRVLYAAQTNGTSVYLDIQFNKEASKKLEEITNNYKTSTDEEGNDNSKKIALLIDGTQILNTSFEEPITTGELQLTVGSTTTSTEGLQDNLKEANNMAAIIGEGNLPVEYSVEDNKYILSDITEDILNKVQIAIAIIVAIGLIILIIKYKTMGLLNAFLYIGLVAIYLLIIRYANVIVSIEGIVGIVLILILNYIFHIILLRKTRGENIQKVDIINGVKDTYKEFFLKILPVCIFSIVFCFIQWTPISSFGMTMFWGIATIAIYHVLVTRNLLKYKAEK